MSLAITVSLYCGRLRRVEVPKKGGAGGLGGFGLGGGVKSAALCIWKSSTLPRSHLGRRLLPHSFFFFCALSLSPPLSLLATVVWVTFVFECHVRYDVSLKDKKTSICTWTTPGYENQIRPKKKNKKNKTSKCWQYKKKKRESIFFP